jgi:methanogenic corrinoid protein MtbC1
VLRRHYLTAQLRGDRREALSLVLTALRDGEEAHAIQQHVIAEAQREVGRLWQENAISVAEEHMATAISQAALAHLYDHAHRASDNGRRVWIACVEGEFHDFPARLVADSLDLAGFEVKYLGANTPTDSLLQLIARERARPDLLALSVTMSFNLPALRDAVAAVRERFPELPIAVGGRGCTPEHAGGLADICANDAQSLVAAARSQLRVTPS